MLRVQEITSLDLPELLPYRTMRRHEEHRRQGIFVVEGERTLRRLLETGFPVVSVLLTPDWLKEFGAALDARSYPVTAYIAEKPVLENLTGFTMFQGILGVARVPEFPTLSGILAASPRPHLFVATDGMSNADNLGTLVRNCAALSVQALLSSKRCSSPFLRRSVRSSMGGIFEVPVLENLDLTEAIAELQRNKVRCIAAHPRPESKPLWEADLASSCCIVFGNEAYGISEDILNACDEAVTIPMRSRVNSLNVSSAGAVFLSEAQRQRRIQAGNDLLLP